MLTFTTKKGKTSWALDHTIKPHCSPFKNTQSELAASWTDGQRRMYYIHMHNNDALSVKEEQKDLVLTKAVATWKQTTSPALQAHICATIQQLEHFVGSAAGSVDPCDICGNAATHQASHQLELETYYFCSSCNECAMNISTAATFSAQLQASFMSITPTQSQSPPDHETIIEINEENHSEYTTLALNHNKFVVHIYGVGVEIPLHNLQLSKGVTRELVHQFFQKVRHVGGMAYDALELPWANNDDDDRDPIVHSYKADDEAKRAEDEAGAKRAEAEAEVKRVEAQAQAKRTEAEAAESERGLYNTNRRKMQRIIAELNNEYAADMAEAKRVEAEAEAKQLEAEAKRAEAEAEAKRVEAEAEVKRVEAEAEAKRVADDEAEAKRVEAEAEAKRAEAEAEAKRAEAEAEAKRVAAEAEAKRADDEAEAKRVEAEAEAKRAEAEAEAKRAEAEAKRVAEDEAEVKRVEAKRADDEAKRVAEAEADAKRVAEAEADAKRVAETEADAADNEKVAGSERGLYGTAQRRMLKLTRQKNVELQRELIEKRGGEGLSSVPFKKAKTHSHGDSDVWLLPPGPMSNGPMSPSTLDAARSLEALATSNTSNASAPHVLPEAVQHPDFVKVLAIPALVTQVRQWKMPKQPRPGNLRRAQLKAEQATRIQALTYAWVHEDARHYLPAADIVWCSANLSSS